MPYALSRPISAIKTGVVIEPASACRVGGGPGFFLDGPEAFSKGEQTECSLRFCRPLANRSGSCQS